MSCCAIGCTNRSEGKRKDLKFYRFPCPKNPFEEERRDRWVQAIRRLDLTGKKVDGVRLCSAHFITGEYSLDRNHPDFVPSIFSFTKPQDLQKGRDRLKRYERTIQRLQRTKGVAYVPDTPTDSSEQRALLTNDTTFHWPSIKKPLPAHMAHITKVEENIHGLKRGEIIPFVIDRRRPPPVSLLPDSSAQQDSDEEHTDAHPSERGVHEDHSYSTRLQPPAQPQLKPITQKPTKPISPFKQPTVSAAKDKSNPQIRRSPEHHTQLPKAAAKNSDARKTTVSKTFEPKDGKAASARPITPDKPPDAFVDEESVSKDHTYTASHPKIDQRSALIQCYICTRTVGVATFRSHMSIHLGIKRHTCSICDKRFAQKAVLMRHMKIHSSEKPFSCLECGQKFKYKTSYRAHLSRHSGVQYECGHCHKKYNNKLSLRVHVRSHEDNYRCPVCRKSFKTIEIANEHFQIHIKEQEIRALSGQASTTDFSTLTFELISSKVSECLCSECGVIFSKEASLKNHVCLHLRERIFQCAGCTLSFSCESKHRRHVLKHHRDVSLSLLPSIFLPLPESAAAPNPAQGAHCSVSSVANAEGAGAAIPPSPVPRTIHLQQNTQLSQENPEHADLQLSRPS